MKKQSSRRTRFPSKAEGVKKDKLKTRQEKKKQMLFRLNILFFIVFLFFSILILRLGIVQIVHGEDFKREIEKTEDVIVRNPVPRGKMYDRNGQIIVGNKAQKAITYTNFGASRNEMLNVAKKLAELINIPHDKVQERDKKDYWILKYPERAAEKVPADERKKLKRKFTGKEYDQKIYTLQLERIVEEDLQDLTEEDLETLAIYRSFLRGDSMTPQIVKNRGVTEEEFALVSENLQFLPGVDLTTDWERVYHFDDTLKTVIGKVTNHEEGVPRENLDYFLARDYSQNDRVGKSYLEMQYENVLQGQRAIMKKITDKKGRIMDTVSVSGGQRGSDIVLTIDMDLQLAVEKIIEEELLKAKKEPNTSLLDRAFVVLIDPNTGEVLTMAGKQLIQNMNTGKQEMHDFALGNIISSYNAGSVVKGATVLTGYQRGVISPGTIMYDEPLKIKDTKEKGSWKKLGKVDDIRALRVSSNVYMFKTAIKIGGGYYQYNKPLSLKKESFDMIRESFSQFGLGVSTGIDLPNESAGYKGTLQDPGLLLDLSIGQYDTYTPMQLAQYISTIANGGYRIRPRIVREVRAPLMNNEELGPVLEEFEPKILSRLKLERKWMENVQEGFRQVMQHWEGTAYKYFGDAPYRPAGKTGTAQAYYDGPRRSEFERPPEVVNLSLVAYAPSDKPEVAMAVLVPWAYEGEKGHNANNIIGRRVLDAYFSLKKKNRS